MSKVSSLIFIPLIIIFLYVVPVQAAPPDFSICEGLSGAARGLCRAGVSAGCADDTGNPGACERIEINFVDVTGDLPPWLAPPTLCPCDYPSLVPLTAEAWSDADGNPKALALNCDAETASLQAINPLPQLPTVNALLTTGSPPQRICQAVPLTGLGEVAGDLTAEELADCRSDVLDYASEFLSLNPGWPSFVDLCSP
jgi:hypothetical protein